MVRNRILFVTLVALAVLAAAVPAFGAEERVSHNKFRQLHTQLRTPNVYRTASGAPGHLYWQQKVDYRIDVELFDDQQRINGQEEITYHNNSPDTLNYLWLQLDQNVRARDSDAIKTRTGSIPDRISKRMLDRFYNEFDGGFKVEAVTDLSDQPLHFVIRDTMMRVDLPDALQPGSSTSLKVKWWYNVNNRLKIGGRSGYEYFEKDDNHLYTIAQFFPRLAVYNEVDGWQHKQFLGAGEFTLPFGDYQVSITVPADHTVAATGVLQNAAEVLTAEQRDLLEKARTAETPVMIVTEAQAIEREKTKATEKKTWHFNAENVRDFAFASSRKFIWDAMGVQFGARNVLAMSFYPKEGNPLWEKYSTKVVAHTIKTYSKFTFDYPYPVAQSIHTDRIGMEYPMICFNGGRPEEDGTYSERTKFGMIGVIIHEVGHNFFPMVVNSDERQWTWMDEGLNTFVQYLTEREWDRDFPARRGPASRIVDYMKGAQDNIAPIMTNSDSVFQLGNNAYAKPTAALNILRETVMGRELFDFAFKEYSRRWMFKHPTPEDFFRTMEDASSVDLDWFWRGWFYTTDYVDIAIDGVKWLQLSTENPEVEKPIQKDHQVEDEVNISAIRNREDIPQTMVDKDPSLEDFYSTYDEFAVTERDRKKYEEYLSSLDEEEKSLLEQGGQFYEISFVNKGGLVMPLILEFEFVDGSKEVQRIPAEIWRYNQDRISKVFLMAKELKSVLLDPFHEIADADLDNNRWPASLHPTRFQLFKQREREGKNPMQEASGQEENGRKDEGSN